MHSSCRTRARISAWRCFLFSLSFSSFFCISASLRSNSACEGAPHTLHAAASRCLAAAAARARRVRVRDGAMHVAESRPGGRAIKRYKEALRKDPTDRDWKDMEEAEKEAQVPPLGERGAVRPPGGRRLQAAARCDGPAFDARRSRCRR